MKHQIFHKELANTNNQCDGPTPCTSVSGSDKSTEVVPPFRWGKSRFSTRRRFQCIDIYRRILVICPHNIADRSYNTDTQTLLQHRVVSQIRAYMYNIRIARCPSFAGLGSLMTTDTAIQWICCEWGYCSRVCFCVTEIVWHCGEHSDSERKEELATYIIVHALQRSLCEVWQPPRVAKWREGGRVTGTFQETNDCKNSVCEGYLEDL